MKHEYPGASSSGVVGRKLLAIEQLEDSQRYSMECHGISPFGTDSMTNVTSRIETLSSAPLDVTVILCTYNRCGDLAGALESIAESEIPDSVGWEILVVDNNSSDQTRNVVQNFCERYPGRFRYLFEPTQGKSYALNTGIKNARGHLLAFTDDDVTVETTWLQNLTSALRDGAWMGVSGRTLPAGKFAPPAWLPRTFYGMIFAYFDAGDRRIELNQPPYGANMAFRKEAFEKYGGFRVDLGPTPGSEIRNEDTELGRRLLSAGERLGYEPSAVVYHPVPQGRTTKQYFLSWWFDFGRAIIKERGDRADVWGIPRDSLALICRFAEISIQAVRGLLTLNPTRRFDYRCQVWKNKGQIAELCRRLVERKRRGTANVAVTDR